MVSNKKKYNVYIVNSFGREIFVGDTYAVSERQACNNVRYRREGNIPNRVYLGEYYEEYQAKEIRKHETI